MTIRWAIFGVGTAGRARAAALAAMPDARLVVLWRGHHAEKLRVPQAETMEQALAACDAVIVSSPDEAHVEQVEAALNAGKHVVCEYPLAPTVAEATRLFALAKSAGRLLHEGHIELLSGTQQMLRGHVAPAALDSMEITSERVGPEVPGSELAIRHVARLHRALDLGGGFGNVERVESRPGELVARIAFQRGAALDLTLRQGPYLKRNTHLVARAAGTEWRFDGSTLYRGTQPQTLLEARSPFQSDLAWAMRRIRDGGDGYVSERRILHVLALAEQLSAGSTGPVRNTFG